MKLFDVYSIWNIEPVKAEGCTLYDKQGNTYLDLYGGHAVISIGHTHPHYVKRVTEQLNKIAFYSNAVENSLQEEFAQKLGELSGYTDYSLFVCNSGAEANENALKLASFHTKKTKVLAFHGAFHGRTSGAVAVTDIPSYRAPFNDSHSVTFVPLNDSTAVERELKSGEYCAVIIEGIQGVGGIQLPTDSFLQQLRTLCTQHNVMLILDEIQSGGGRTGKYFAHQYANIRPDLITLAKGIGNGFPMAAVMISPAFEAVKNSLGTTFGGNHLACAAGIAVVEVMQDEHLMDNAQVVGNFLLSELKKIEGVKEVRGLGLMIGIEMHQPIAEIRKKLLFEHKIFTGVTGANIIRLLPPLCLTKQQAEGFLSVIKGIIINK